MSGRIRSLKPEWLEDEALTGCSSDARVVSAALLLLADDHGNGRGSERYLGAQIFPGDTLAKVRVALAELTRIRYVGLYEVDGQTYFAIRNWEKHQKVDRPGKPRVPVPLEGFRVSLAKIPVGHDTSSRLIPIPIPIPIPTSYQDHDHDHDPITFAPSKIFEEAHKEIELRPKPLPKAKKPKALPVADAPGLRELTDLWFFEFEKYYARKPAWNGVQASKLKQLIAQSDLEEMRTLIPAFFAWKRPEVIKGGHSLWKGYTSLTAKLDELRADLAHPERRAFAAEFASHEQQANHEAQGAAQTKRIVAAATGNPDAHTPFRVTTAPSDQTVRLDTTGSRRPRPEDVRRSDHRLVQGAGSVRPGNGHLASNGVSLRRGPDAEPPPHEGTDAWQAGGEPIYGPDDDEGAA